MSAPYQVFNWWKANVEKRIITEDGAYAEGQVPPSYTGAQLEMTMLQRVYFTNSAGEIFELRMDNLRDVMDANDAPIQGAVVQYPDGATLTVGAAPTTSWTLISNPDIDGPTNEKATQMYKVLAEREPRD